MTGLPEVRTHRLSRRDVHGLATGLGGPEAVRALASVQYSKHVLLIYAISELAEEGSEARLTYRRLAGMHERRPEGAADLIERPEVGAWANDCVRGLREDRPDASCAPAPGLAEPPETAASRCRTECGGIVLDVALDGHNPHLDRYRYALDQAYDLPAWRRRLAGAWRILVSRHRSEAEEIATGLRTIVPLKAVAGAKVVSATSPAAFGAIASSLPPDEVTLAETLVHEFQHVKLGALLDALPLVRQVPAPEPTYYAPWRDDPRPLVGLLQGAYAFFGVTRFWRIQRFATAGPRGHVEFARRRAEVLQVTSTLLESGRLAPDGVEFVTLMRDRLTDWRSEPVPTEARLEAARLSAAHRRQWSSP